MPKIVLVFWLWTRDQGQWGQWAALSSNFKPNFDPRAWRYRTHVPFQQRSGKGNSITSPSTDSSSLWGSHCVGMSGTPVGQWQRWSLPPLCLLSSTPSCVCCRQHWGGPWKQNPQSIQRPFNPATATRLFTVTNLDKFDFLVFFNPIIFSNILLIL